MTRTLAKRREKNEELKREKEILEREINEMKAKKSHLQGMQNVQIYSIALHPVNANFARKILLNNSYIHTKYQI